MSEWKWRRVGKRSHDHRCHLYDLLPIAAQTANDTLAELDWVVTDAGFQVIRLRYGDSR